MNSFIANLEIEDWTSACEPSAGTAGPVYPNATAMVATQCCPRSYDCDSQNAPLQNWYWCTSVVAATSTRVLNLSTSNYQDADGSWTFKQSSSWVTAHFKSAEVVRAKPIFVGNAPASVPASATSSYTSADVLSSTFTTSVAGSRTTLASTTTTAVGAAQPETTSTSKHGFPQSGKIAVGIVVPIVVIAFLIAGFLFWKKRSANRRAAEMAAYTNRKSVESHQSDSETYGMATKIELDGVAPIPPVEMHVEQAGQMHPRQPQEMHSPVQPSELSSPTDIVSPQTPQWRPTERGEQSIYSEYWR